jgi:pimeloyl-ACP methyl ester carboxylesterase
MNLPVELHGFLPPGIPYNRTGQGPRPLIVFHGLQFEHKPLFGVDGVGLMSYRFLEKDFTIYHVSRRPNPPPGFSLLDMACDYAEMIRCGFDGPVDLLGVSTGGSIALVFAIHFPNLVRRLVIHSSGHTLGPAGKELQLEVGRLAEAGRWRAASTALMNFILPALPGKMLLVGLASWLVSLKSPSSAVDIVTTILAEDCLACRDSLSAIQAPTLVAGGAKDPFYTPAIFKETAQGILHGRLALYENQGHPAGGKEFQKAVLTHLLAE